MKEKEKSLSAAATDQKGHHLNNSVNLHSLLADVKSNPEMSFPPHPIHEIYQNPYLTEGSSGIFTTSEQKTIPTYTEKKEFSLYDFELLSLDKMAILFNAPKFNRENPALVKFWNTFDTMINYGNPQILSSNKLYKHSCVWNEFFHIQWGSIDSRMPTIRLEFNPNHAKIKLLIPFFTCMKEHAFKMARVSRIDIAVDYAIYLNPLCWISKNIIVDSIFRRHKQIETWYFGSVGSDCQIRIYNKAAELKAKEKIDLGFDFWRVEAEVHAISGDSFSLIDDQSISNFNPFERISFYDPFGFKVDKAGVYSLFVEYARVVGVDRAISFFNPKTKIKYLDKLKCDMIKLSFHLPANIYKHCFNRLYIRLVNELYKHFEKGQEIRKSKQFMEVYV